jgi:hypothetical protein
VAILALGDDNLHLRPGCKAAWLKAQKICMRTSIYCNKQSRAQDIEGITIQEHEYHLLYSTNRGRKKVFF